MFKLLLYFCLKISVLVDNLWNKGYFNITQINRSLSERLLIIEYGGIYD